MTHGSDEASSIHHTLRERERNIKLMQRSVSNASQHHLVILDYSVSRRRDQKVTALVPTQAVDDASMTFQNHYQLKCRHLHNYVHQRI